MRKRLLWAALGTLIIFPLIGWGVLSIFEENALEIIFRSPVSVWIQIPTGIVLGLLLGFGAQYVVTRPFLGGVEKKYSRMIAGLNITHWQVIFISLCAGFGEELLFRGAIQPLIGVWITAIIFVAIHGYLDPRDWKMSVYGVYMTIAIAALGYYTDHVGIIGACLAHAGIDYVLFKHLIKSGQSHLHHKPQIKWDEANSNESEGEENPHQLMTTKGLSDS